MKKKKPDGISRKTKALEMSESFDGKVEKQRNEECTVLPAGIFLVSPLTASLSQI